MIIPDLLREFGGMVQLVSGDRQGLTHRRNGAGVCGRLAQILVQCHWSGGVAQGIKCNDIALCGVGQPPAGCEGVGEGLSQHWNRTCHVQKSSCESESPSDMTAKISDLGNCKKI